jgi:hypothetical protein
MRRAPTASERHVCNSSARRWAFLRLIFLRVAPTAGKKQPAPQEGELSENDIVSFLGTREGAALVRAFMAIKQKPIRHTAITFLETLKGK